MLKHKELNSIKPICVNTVSTMGFRDRYSGVHGQDQSVSDVMGISDLPRSCGIGPLDQIIGGGILPGSVVCILTNPMSMVEVMLYQLASAGKTTYFATERSPKQVLRNMSQLGFDCGEIKFVDIYGRFNHPNEGSVQRNPTAQRNLYQLAYIGAKNDAKLFVESVKLPEDVLWKFEFWSEDKAITVMGDLCGKIFSKLLQVNDKSRLQFVSADTKNKRFVIEFEESPECNGISGFRNGVCYYHSGLFAGMLSMLLDQELSAYEDRCRAAGSDVCRFVVGPSDDPVMQQNLERYINPAERSKIDDAIAFLGDAMQEVGSGPEGQIIIDTFSFFIELTDDPDKVRTLLNLVYDTTAETGGICYLYLLKKSHPPDVENMVLSKCDIIFDLDTDLSGGSITNLLLVPKIRGAVAPDTLIRLHIKDRVMLDTSVEVA